MFREYVSFDCLSQLVGNFVLGNLSLWSSLLRIGGKARVRIQVLEGGFTLIQPCEVLALFQ